MKKGSMHHVPCRYWFSFLVIAWNLLYGLLPSSCTNGFVVHPTTPDIVASSKFKTSSSTLLRHQNQYIQEDGDYISENSDKTQQYSFESSITITTSRRRFFAGVGSISSSASFLAAILSNPRTGYADDDVATTMIVPTAAAATTDITSTTTTTTTVPLIYTGQELLISYEVDGSIFKAVLDTGSPFLMIPGSCGYNTQRKSGCYNNQGQSTNLETTIEIFDGFQGEVEWKLGTFDFVNATTITTTTTTTNEPTVDTGINSIQHGSSIVKRSDKNVIFGVASEDIMTGPGGVFFGMIKNTDSRIRPSFLGQTNTQAFQVNLATRPRTLTLSDGPMIDPTNSEYIPMTNVLRRRYGDPVGHYTARAKSIEVNGYPLLSGTASSSVFVIFDTGVTGMLLSRGLFNENYIMARKQKAKNLFGNVSLSFETSQKKIVTLSATKPITTPFDPEDTWKRFPKNSHLIVMGLSFLEGHVLTVDIDKERLWVE